MDAQRKDSLIRITTFNLEARYPDESRNFRKICTEEFTRLELTRIKELFQWLNNMIP